MLCPTNHRKFLFTSCFSGRKNFYVPIAAIALLFVFNNSFALQPDTWKLVHRFERSIGCGFFFDKDHGLIGSGVRPAEYQDPNGLFHVVPGDTVAIYKTTDGGVTWTTSQVPVSLPGAVTS
ncbi:MAG TPA: hypothetical protein VG537_10560, partial [Candidatus Kapabacteria bacterium]|nr:hypothetical protein [Candidatus Kapabacteria bacterium]